MKQIIIYIFLSLIFISCDKEEIMPTVKENKTVKVPFSVAISSKAGSKQTKAGEYIPPVVGESNVNTLRICIFENISGSVSFDDLDQFLYVGEGEVTDGLNSPTDSIAQGNFTANTSSSYLILGLAYHSSYENELTKVADGTGKEHLFAINTTLTAAKVSLENHITPELFAGYLYKAGDPQDHSIYPDKDFDENTHLEGHLYRAVGYIAISLTDIPVETDDIKSLSLVSQLVPTSNDAYDKYFILNATQSYLYPMGYINESLSITNSTVATVEANDIKDGKAVLSTYLFPFDTHGNEPNQVSNRTYFYVDVTTNSNSVTRYVVQCQDTEWEPTIWTGLYDKLIKSSSFTIKHNWQIKLSGTFKTLTSGNLRIDQGPMDEVFGGILTE